MSDTQPVTRAEHKALEKRMDRRDTVIDKEHENIWGKIDHLWERLERLPAWATKLFMVLTMIIGILSGWLLKSVFD